MRVADLNEDGVEDIAAALFGWHSTGSLRWLEGPLRLPPQDLQPKQDWRTLDSRPGAIHVIPGDLDGDGRIELVSLISQEHERIEAWRYNDGRWSATTIYAAPDPAFGSSSIELCDLDGDGDQDIVYANGDTFDSHYIKPYHGVRWLENPGRLPFIAHELAIMPGVHRALPADLDGDGDLDIVAVSMLPGRLINQVRSAADLDSVVWLEQVADGGFVRHSLERGLHHHATLDVGDFDSDGDVDLAIGQFHESGAGQPLVSVWWNDR